MNYYIHSRLILTEDDMKKNENKQKKTRTHVKQVLEEDGRKLKWLSGATGINYQRLQRIVNQGYEPTITEAARISNAVKRLLSELFPSPELYNALVQDAEKGTLVSVSS